MRKNPAKRTAHEVRDHLEQALFTLPRGSKSAEQIASQIEEAIEIAIEREFAPTKPARRRAIPD